MAEAGSAFCAPREPSETDDRRSRDDRQRRADRGRNPRQVGRRPQDPDRCLARVAVAGWLLRVGLGYLFAHAIGWAAGEATGIDIALVFPLAYAGISRIGTVVLALVVMLAPLRRAVRFKPGEALRYA